MSAGTNKMPNGGNDFVPNEAKTWEELMKIKAMPIPMAQKKALKAQLSMLPILKLKGWRLFKWKYLKAIKSFWREWTHRWRSIVILQSALRSIEIKCGTSIVNVFLFIKWTLILNVIMFTIILFFIIFPFFAHHQWDETTRYDDAICPLPNGPFKTLVEEFECCTKTHKIDLRDPTRESISNFIENLFNMDDSIENNPFFYGFYQPEDVHLEYNLPLAYALVTALIFVFCLAIMVRIIGTGFKEMVLAREGDHYKYSSLIFGGWDHCTKTEACAQFKRKVIQHEIQIALQTETTKTHDLIKNRKQSMKRRIIKITGHLIVLSLWTLIGLLIYVTTDLSLTATKEARKTGGQKGAYILFSFGPQLVIIISNMTFPNILGWLSKFEKYSIQTQTTLTLIRSLFVRLLGLGLPSYLFYKNQYCAIAPSTCTKCVKEDHKPIISCWETLVSELIYKLIITDLTLKCLITFIWEPTRVLIGKKFDCWIAKKLSKIKFNIVRHSLDIIYIQALSWMGLYFSPVLPGVIAMYCFIVFYTKKFSVMNNCNAVPDTFRTTRTTTIFIFTKLFSFIAATISIVFVLGYMNPSKGCGPFRDHSTPWQAVNRSLKKREMLNHFVHLIISPGVTTPATILLILGIYYYYSVAQANREMVETLKHLLVLEGHDKQYLFARLTALRKKSRDDGGEDRTNASSEYTTSTIISSA